MWAVGLLCYPEYKAEALGSSMNLKFVAREAQAAVVAEYMQDAEEHDLHVDENGSMSDCCGRDIEYDVENEVWFCGLCGEPCGVL